MKDAAIYLNDPLDENELAEKVNLLWNDSHLRKKIVNKGDTILKKYSIGNFKKELKDVYFSMLSDPA